MADDNAGDDNSEVFDFESTEFTRDDLVGALHDMVNKYSKLSKSFEKVKAEKKNLTYQVGKSTCCKVYLLKLVS